ncbi:hypothetical protein BD410DRAFT_793253 [Rickenella mellea]|uniref:Uncharacterized protein n=1 Tax=Rickenella mellea TaxID=50990 RepID=A0A4Y7PTQ0_9AGAM|nr:hypothetical protein BD410DRAFT_793253 [Rickenella mellea]
MNIPPQFSTQNTGPHKPQHEENSPDNGRDDTPKRPPNPNPCAACSLPTVKSKVCPLFIPSLRY